MSLNPVLKSQPQTCPHCHTPNRAGDESCANCGLVFATYTPERKSTTTVKIPLVQNGSESAAASPITCPRCGWTSQARVNACANCGNPLFRPLAPGEPLANGRYTVQRALSKGGMGDIYLATDHDAFDRIVVIKAMLDYFDPTNTGEIQAAKERFVQEARTLSTLSHQAIPKIFTYFQDGPHNYIVMEYIEGRDLEQGLTHDDARGKHIAGKPYPQEEVIRWGIALCRVLEYLASLKPNPVVHHDIKPANILLDTNGDIRLVDFGTAKARLLVQMGGGVGLQKSSIYGTQGYAPAEQYKGKSEPRSDVYALAATLYHLATDDDPRSHPFAFPRLKQLGAFGQALSSALSIDVNHRVSAAELRHELETLLVSPATRSIQTPDGQNVSNEQELVAWCEQHWPEATNWLYDRDKLSEQIERLWGKNKLANDIRKTVQAYSFGGDHYEGLDAVLALLDPQGYGAVKPELEADTEYIDFGSLTAYAQSSRQVTVTNSGRRYAVAQLQYPHWMSTPTSNITLLPGRKITITLIADMRRSAFGGDMDGVVVGHHAAAPLFEILVEAHVSRWRTFLRRFSLLIAIFVLLLLALPFVGTRIYNESYKALHYQAGIAAMQTGRWDDARAEFTLVQAAQPNYSDSATMIKESYYQPAKAAIDGGLWETARNNLTQLLKIDPNYKDAQVLLKESYYRPAYSAMTNGDWQAARAQLEPLVQMDASYNDALDLLKQSYYYPAKSAIDAQQWQAARDQLLPLLKLDNNFRDALTLLKECYYQPMLIAITDQRWEQAAQDYVGLEAIDRYYRDEAVLLGRYPDLMRQVGIRHASSWQSGNVTSDPASSLSGHSASVIGIAYSSDGQTLISGSLDNTIRLWSVRNGQALQTITTTFATTWNVAISPDAQTIAASGDDKAGSLIRLWHSYDGQVQATLSGQRGRIYSIAFSPDGQTLASAGEDGTIKFWRISDGRLLQTIAVRSVVDCIAFNPDGLTLASGGADHIVHIWNVSDGSLRQELRDDNNVIYSVAYSPDGQLLAAGGADNSVYLWHASDGSLIRRMIGHKGKVYDVVFTPDGQTLASASEDKTIRLWSVSSGKTIQTLNRSSIGMSNIAFNPNGQQLASGTDGNTIEFWHPE